MMVSYFEVRLVSVNITVAQETKINNVKSKEVICKPRKEKSNEKVFLKWRGRSYQLSF